MSSPFVSEFLMVAGAHLLAVASPGPDFAIVMRQSLMHGRAVALRTSLGIGTAILVHVSYTLLGVGWLLRKSDMAFGFVKWAGTLYLAWLAIQCLRAMPKTASAHTSLPVAAEGGTPAKGAFLTGFLTNVLNPKATIFFLALFSAGISSTTPKWVIAGYGLWMAVATATWFCLVSIVFTRPEVRARFLRVSHWVDRATGVVLLGFAVKLALAAR